MYIRVLLAALVTAAVTGCTSYSTPTTNTDVVTLNTGDQAWRVQCQGLFESSKTCMNRAQEICKDQKIRLVGLVDHMSSDRKPVNDPREITFKCGDAPAPAAAPAPAPAVAPVPVPARAAAKPIRALTLQGDANFATNSAELSPIAQRKLDEFVEANKGYRIERLSIAGYTDSTGSMALNERLSEARARSAQNYLMSHGLRADNYEVHGFGPASPVASNATAAGRAQNRRVEINTDGVEIRAMGQ
ncbi:OmpA family protein [Caballeronia ptereochthonis]|uniref:OmpA/MotB domain-containing protein n=1 Tax=Caballeronia ptereochthonis TaxID=1777144 RepID=A0A158DMJ7_9BURK|nr:OmpA family protein [Caballeronia ptereochthonis]SAK95871.1 OmpA/MotB domain-containing protein [Caballeronia ptereochthonis]